MTTAVALLDRPHRTRPNAWLWLTAPIAALGILSSALGVLVGGTYARETADWAGQAVGQDIANMAACAAIVGAAVATARGSLRAHLAWLGLLAYTAYSFAIYAFAVHHGRLFLVYVLVFGLSIYALIGGLTTIDPGRVRAAASRAAVRATAIPVIAIGVVFYVLWLSEIVPTIVTGEVPRAVRDAGLLANPVYVLDMAVLLPAAILGGGLLLRRRAWGFVLVPTVLGCFICLGVGIVAAVLVLRGRGEAAPVQVAVGVGGLTVLESIVLVRYLAAVVDR